MARKLTACLVAGWAAALVLVVGGQGPAEGADSPPVIAGTFTGQLKLTDSWQPGGWGFEPGPRSFSFGKGCPVGSACSVTNVTAGQSQAVTPQAGGFGWSDSFPAGCYDLDTGALRTNNGFDYTYKVRFSPSATTVRDGVTYVTALRGTFDGKIAVNATGRANDCLVNPRRVPSETEHGVYTLKLAPLAAPKVITSTPPMTVAQPPTTEASTIPGFHLPQTDRQQSSAEAVADGRRSSFPGALTAPSDALRNLGDRLPQDLLLVALLGLLMIFPAQIFNSTYEDNHERIDRQLARLRPRRRAPSAIPTQRDPAPEPSSGPPPGSATAVPSRGRRLGVFLGCALAGTLLGGLLDPEFGANTASYALMAGLFLALVLTVLVVALTGRLFRSATHHGHEWYLRAIPSALLIALLCVVVSRVTHFEPGYLYGVLGGAVFAASLERRSEGRAEVAISVVALVLALGAWVVFEPVANAANGADPAFWLLGTDAFLAALFIGGIEGLLFGLIPLRFLPGYRVKGWNWIAWGVLTAVVLYTFVHVLLLPEAGYLGRSTAASVQLSVVLFVAFGVASGVFWLWFRLRPTQPVDELEELPAVDASPVTVTIDPVAPAATRPWRRAKVPASTAPGAPPPLPLQGQPDQDGKS
ncbi:MAG: hypothetical protein JWR85_1502 [Marmoricola sp.]|nr:hypothetical protein [Marmoricola sp.]